MEVNQSDSCKSIISDVDVDVENKCKELEAKIEPLIRKLEEFNRNRYNRKHRRWGRKALERKRSKVKRQLANFWKELIVLKQESKRKQPKRWSVNEEVQILFTVALKLSYPEFEDIENSTVAFSISEYGDFFCEDVLKIWPKLRGGEGKPHLGPRRVGYQIKKNVQVQQSGILMDGLAYVMDIGFVAILLSGKWMAKGLHKLLRDGVDTWAPPLFMKKNYLVNIYFPTCNMADLSDMDSLRRELIKETLINFLQYCKVDWCSMPCGMDLPQEESDKFRTMIQDEDVLIFPNAEGKHEPLIHVKGGSSDPLIDLKNLWYGLEKKRANWIVYLTPVQKQEYIQMCFSAAQHAKWLSSDQGDLHRASYTGYQSCNTSMEDLVAKAEEEDLRSLLDKVKVSDTGYTRDEVLKCAVKYSVLKNHRLDVCKFSFEEMLDEEKDTFVYLLNTQVRNRSFTKERSKDIDELTLGEDEIWEEGEERVLVLRLLEFTEVIASSCYPVLPHKLCKYLYALSRRFNSVCDSWEDRELSMLEVGIAETNLLLCKATEVVMEKCFALLGITPESSSSGDKQESSGFLNSLLLQVEQESLGLPKSLLQVGRLNHRDPPKKPNSRFQLFSVYIDIDMTRYPKVQEWMLFGEIRISDTYGVLYHGWGRVSTPDGGTVALLHGNLHNQISATNNGELDLGNPIQFPPSIISTQVVPLSSSMEISTDLYATTMKEDVLFQISGSCAMDFAYFWKLESDTKCGTLPVESVDGGVRMYYALLRDAVDCVIKVRYNFNKHREVDVQVCASYGSDLVEKNEDLAAKYYTASLYDGQLAGKVGQVPLKRSMMAVPAKGSIVIKARIPDCDIEKKHGLDEALTFKAQPGGECKQEMRGSCGCCYLSVSLVWRV